MTDFAVFLAPIGRWLVHSLWQGVVVLVACLLLRPAMRRQSAALECRVTTSALVAVALLPFLTAGAAWFAGGMEPAATAALGRSGSVVPVSADLLRLMQRHLTFDTARGVFGVWLVGTVLSLAWLLLGTWRARLILADSRPCAVPAAPQLAHQVGLRAMPEMREWHGARTPFVLGGLRPVVVLPPGLDRVLDAREFESVLLHELAHVTRRDVGANLLLRLLGALAWYQLPFWILLRELERARERACDDLAVRAMGRSLPLARALVFLEERRAGGPRLAMAGTGGDFAARIRRILSEAGPSVPGSRRLASVALVSLLVVTGSTLLYAGSAEDSLSRWARGVHALVQARDPAGPFTVELVGGTLVAATIDGSPVPSDRIVQEGPRVALLDADGRSQLTLRVEAPGTIHWTPRPPRSP